MKASRPARRAHAAAVLPVAKPAVPIWPWLAAMGAAVIAVFFVYGPAMNGPFLLDDTYLPYVMPEYANGSLKSWMQGMRPILMLSYWLNFQQAAGSTAPYHFVNVLLHLLNGGLTFLAVRRILAWAGIDESKLNLFAGFAGGLFLLHPVQTESVSYIASRSDTLSVFFFLASFCVFLYRRSRGISLVTSAAVLVLFGAACLTKEHAAVLPGLLLLTDYFWNPGFQVDGIRRNWKIYAPMLLGAVFAGLFVWRVLSTATTAGFRMKDLTWYQYFFTQCRALWRYLLFFVLPVGQNIDHDFRVSKTVIDQGAIAGLIGLAALIIAAWIYRRRFPLVSYGLFVFLLLIAPTSSVAPIKDTLVEHRMYLPFIGLLVAAMGLLNLWKTKRSTLLATLGFVLLVEAGLAYQRNQLWGSEIGIWADSASKSPAKMRPNFQLASAYYMAGKCGESVSQYARTAPLDPGDSSLLVNWGLAADCAGNPAAALEKFLQAAAIAKTAHIYSQIGMEYAKIGQYPQALDALDTAAKLDSGWEMTYVYRGNVYALKGDKVSAAADYQRALALDPQNQGARAGLVALGRR